MKKIIFTLFIVILALSIVACSSTPQASDSKTGNGEKAELTLVMRNNEASDEQMKTLLQEFNKKYPDINVKRIQVVSDGWSDLFNKIQTMMAGGNSPDVMMVPIEGIQLFYKQDFLLPLDSYMKSDPDAVENYADLHPKLQAPFVIDGKTYGFVWEWSSIVTHLNTDMLKEVGLPLPPKDWTLNDFLNYAQKLTYEKNGKKVYGFAIPTNYFTASAWLFNNNASVLNDAMDTSKLDDPNAIEVLQLFQDLIYKYKVAPVPSPKDDPTQMFINGQVAMFSAGRWPSTTYKANNFKSVDVQYLPILKTSKAIFGSGGFPVFKSTKYPKAAYELAAFLSGSFSQKLTLSAAATPTRKSVMEEVLPNTGVNNWKIFEESADIAKPVEAPPQYADIESIFNRYMSAILSNQMDAASAAKKAKQEIDAALKK